MRQQRPPKWPRDPHVLRWPAPGLRPLASAAFGHGDRLGILRVQGALVIHVVLEYCIIIINLYWYCTLQCSVVQYCCTSLQYCSTEGTLFVCSLDIQCVHWISIKHTGYPVSSLAYPVCTLGRKSARFQCANWARLPVYTLDTQCAHWTSNVYTGICVLAGCNIYT